MISLRWHVKTRSSSNRPCFKSICVCFAMRCASEHQMVVDYKLISKHSPEVVCSIQLICGALKSPMIRYHSGLLQEHIWLKIKSSKRRRGRQSIPSIVTNQCLDLTVQHATSHLPLSCSSDVPNCTQKWSLKDSTMPPSLWFITLSLLIQMYPSTIGEQFIFTMIHVSAITIISGANPSTVKLSFNVLFLRDYERSCSKRFKCVEYHSSCPYMSREHWLPSFLNANIFVVCHIIKSMTRNVRECGDIRRTLFTARLSL